MRTFTARIVAFSLVSLVGCAALRPYLKSFGACMESKGLTAGSDVAATVEGDLNSPADEATILGQLTTLAVTAGEDTVTCAVQAWQANHVTPTSASKPRAVRTTGENAADTWMSQHKH